MGKAKDSSPGSEPTQTAATPGDQVAGHQVKTEPPAEPGGAPLSQDDRAEDQPPSQVAQLSELATELERQRDELRDYEKGLVERIADVDDDRRMTTSKLQRAWQTQREAIENQWRRHMVITAGSLALLAILVAAALFLLYRQIGVAQGPLVERISETRLELDRIAGGDGQDEAIEGRLTQLVDDITETSSSLAQLNQEREQAVQAALAEERTSREQGDAGIVAELRALKNEQPDLKQELASLREALTSATAGNRPGRPGADDGVAEQRVAELRFIKDEQRRLKQELASLREALSAATAGIRSGPADDGMGVREAVPPRGEEAAALVQPLPEETASLPATGTDSAEVAGAEGEAGTAQADVDSGERVSATGEESDPAVAENEGTPPSGAAAPVATGESLTVGGPSYAVQLIGFYDLESLVKFARREGLPTRAYYLRQTFNDRPWYAMIHSLHDTYASAAAELSRLTAELAGLNPWIRPIPPNTELEPIATGPGREEGEP